MRDEIRHAAGRGGEGPVRSIIGAEIREELRRDLPIIEKPYLYESGAMERAIGECKVPENFARKLNEVTRDKLHLLRMLRRSEAERNFSLAYLRYADDIFGEDKGAALEIRGVISSGGADTAMFWTFAPYLFRVLTRKGLSERDAVSKMLSWSKDGVSEWTESNKARGESKNWGELHLRGLEKYNSEIGGVWMLNRDPEHISHKYTEQEAEHIADLLMGEGDGK
ncbi:MAG: hypothetical protein WC862_01855 [Patescibacteria group bacterium]